MAGIGVWLKEKESDLLMDLNIPELLLELAKRRPVFHSEADLQHELAWQLREQDKSLQVFLEYPLKKGSSAAIDILIRKGSHQMALELKYLCWRFDHTMGDGVEFFLKSQGAQNIRCYDVWKDVERMEQFIAAHSGASAGVLVLTNDSKYWKGPKRDNTSAAAFSLREGRKVGPSELDWAAHTGPDTKKGREAAIELGGKYSINWQGYSHIKIPEGNFRFLHLPVSNPHS